MNLQSSPKYHRFLMPAGERPSPAALLTIAPAPLVNSLVVVVILSIIVLRSSG